MSLPLGLMAPGQQHPAQLYLSSRFSGSFFHQSSEESRGSGFLEIWVGLRGTVVSEHQPPWSHLVTGPQGALRRNTLHLVALTTPECQSEAPRGLTERSRSRWNLLSSRCAPTQRRLGLIEAETDSKK